MNCHTSRRRRADVDHPAQVAACLPDIPVDATCFICQSGAAAAGLVRACACRGTMGIAHVSCLVKQARVLTADHEASMSWWRCIICRQEHRVPLKLALSWANWASYLDWTIHNCSRARAMLFRSRAVYAVGISLVEHSRPAEALPVLESCLEESRREFPDCQEIHHSYETAVASARAHRDVAASEGMQYSYSAAIARFGR